MMLIMMMMVVVVVMMMMIQGEDKKVDNDKYDDKNYFTCTAAPSSSLSSIL